MRCRTHPAPKPRAPVDKASAAPRYSLNMFSGSWGMRWRRAERDPLRGALGSLEREVMEIVWQSDAVTVRDAHARLGRPVAYTTVMTTLDRLFKKGFVARTRNGRAFVYTAAQSRQQVEAVVASGVLTGLLSNGAGAAMPILSNLVDAVGHQDGGLDFLDALEQMVQDTRRKLAASDPDTEEEPS
jgi:predicted transcriptional regulator